MYTKPKGTKDIYGSEAKKWIYVSSLLDRVMERYGYSYIRTPIFETTELFHRSVGDTTDLVTKETYDFKDRGDRDITLRPEGTAGVVRSYIEEKMYGDVNQPIKLYYNGTMYRYERPQAGRYRELTQFGFEILGSDDPMTDAEMISIPYNFLKILKLKGIKVQINTLGDKESRDNYRKALVDYFKPHIDEFCPDCKNRLEKNPLRILDCKVDNENPIMKNAPKTLDYLNEASRIRYEKVKEYLDILVVEYEECPNLVRGLDYYDHIVFEIEAIVTGKKMAIGGGGRYNGLVELLGGPATSAVGYAAGMDRVMLAIEEEGIKLEINDSLDAFVMFVNEEEKKTAIYLTQVLRMNGFRTETDYNERSLKAQFKAADRLGAKFLIILNGDDLTNGLITVKNNSTKEEEKVTMEELMYFLDEHLNEDDCDCDDDCNCESSHGCDCMNGEECSCGEDHECHCDHNHEKE